MNQLFLRILDLCLTRKYFLREYPYSRRLVSFVSFVKPFPPTVVMISYDFPFLQGGLWSRNWISPEDMKRRMNNLLITSFCKLIKATNSFLGKRKMKENNWTTKMLSMYKQ